MQADAEQLGRAVVNAWNRRDAEELIGFFAPDCEVYAVVTLTPEPYRGHEGVRQWLREATESFGSFEVSLVSVRADGNQLLVRATVALEGAGSGLQMTPEIAYLGTLEDGLLKTLRIFTRYDDAVEAAAGS